MLRLQHFIAGKFVESVDSATLDIVDPSTEEVYAIAPVATANEIDAAFAAAETAFATWRKTTPSERQRALLRIADAIEERAEDLLAAECRNTGKPIALTRSEEIPPAADQIRFFAGAARMLEGKSAGEYAAGLTSYVRREPVGVIAQVTPWNYPLMMAVWKFAPAIAAGNTVVLKPSDTTPVSTLLLAEIAAQFLPAGVLNVVLGDRATGRALIEHPTPAMVSITGSTRAGMEVAKSAAADLKRVHLELGGQAPCVVFADADLTGAATGIVDAALFNAGQDCTSATRVIVAAAAHDEFVALLKEKCEAIVTGPPSNEDAYYGPLNNAAQLNRVQAIFANLPTHAQIVTGGTRVGDVGYFFAPTVVTGLKQDDDIIQHEVFGPVLTVQKFTDEAEAIELANGVEFALASSVWTTDHATAVRLSAELEFGCVWINTHIPVAAEMPHGGFKHSGYGKDLSAYGFEDYTRIKHVMTAF